MKTRRHVSIAAILTILGLLVATSCVSQSGGGIPEFDAYVPESYGEAVPEEAPEIFPPQAEGVPAYIEERVKDTGFSGVILVAEKGKVAFRKAYGYADFEGGVANTPETAFKIASNSKQFTAMAIMILQERGLLSVEDTLDEYISDFPAGKGIRIYNLLTMTSGWGRDQGSDAFDRLDLSRAYTPEELVRLAIAEKGSEPGKRYDYCNANYYILGYIIEKVSGMTWGDFVQENILKPLGMSHTGYGPVAGKGVVDAIGYSPGEGVEKAEVWDLSYCYATGGLSSTVDDLLLWDRGLRDNTLISAESTAAMFAGNISGYASGWQRGHMVLPSGNCLLLYHGGGIPGFVSFIYRNMDRDSLIVILCNRVQALDADLLATVREIEKRMDYAK